MKRITTIIFTLILIITLCGCNLNKKGETLHSFTERMNTLNSDYNLSENGYIYSPTGKTLKKFFRLDNSEILLSFNLSKENELSAAHIIFDKKSINNENAYNFIKNIITSFINDETTEANLLENTNFQKNIRKSSLKTYSSVYEGQSMSFDVTDKYICITLVKNNL